MGIPAPILNLDFVNAQQRHPAVTFSRTSIGAYWQSGPNVGADGRLVYAPTGVPRFDNDPLTGVCKGLLIEPAVTFLTQFSNQLDNSYYIKSAATVTPNAAVGPDAGATADKVVDSTANTVHLVYTNSFAITAGAVITGMSVLKKAERTAAAVIVCNSSISSYARVAVDLDAGTLGAITLAGTASSASASIENLGNGYYKITLTCIIDAVSTYARVGVYTAIGTTISYVGDGVSGILVAGIWGYAGSGPASTVPTGWETTSTSSNDIGTGAKTFTVSNSLVAGQAIPVGASVRVWQTSNPANYMTGAVTSHSGTALACSITAVGGNGTGITDWTIQAGASVTRAGDVCSADLRQLTDAGGNALWTGVEGTIVIDFQLNNIPSNTVYPRIMQLTFDNSNRISLFISGSSIYYAIVSGGTTVMIPMATVADTARHKIVAAFSAGRPAASMDGIGIVTFGSDIIMPTPATYLELMSSLLQGQNSGCVKSVQLYNRRIANEYFAKL